MVVSKKLRSPSDHFSDLLSPHVKLANNEIAARRAPRVQLVQLVLWCSGAARRAERARASSDPCFSNFRVLVHGNWQHA